MRYLAVAGGVATGDRTGAAADAMRFDAASCLTKPTDVDDIIAVLTEAAGG